MIKDILAVVMLVAQLVKDLPQHKEHMMWIKRIALAKRRMDKQQDIARTRLHKLITGSSSSKNWHRADLLKGDHVISISLCSMDGGGKNIKKDCYPPLGMINDSLHNVIIEVVRHNLMVLVNQTSYSVGFMDESVVKKIDDVIMKRLVYLLSHEQQLSTFFNYSKDFIQSVITWRCLRDYFSHWVTSLNSLDQGYRRQITEELDDNPSSITTYRYKIANLGSQNPFMNSKTIYVTIEYPSISSIIRSGKSQWRYVLNWYRDYKRFKITFG